MKCYARGVSMALLLLIAISLATVKGQSTNVKELMEYALNKIQFLIDQNNFYQSVAAVDENDVGTASDRDKTLDDKVTVQEQMKLAFEACCEKLNLFNLPPEQQDSIKSDLKSDMAFNAMTMMCKEFSKRFPACNKDYPYRTFDGTCNNFEHPTWGSVLECTRRNLPANYKDVNDFRQSVNGNPLPNPRKLSLKLHRNIDNPNDVVCHMIMFYGQFLDHDITKTATSTANGVDLQCCAPTDNPHPQCAPIILDNDDPFYQTFNKTCMNFVRSAPCSTCDFSKRTQMNTVTAFIDCSHVYGVTKQKSDELRALDGSGKLKAQFSPQGELLPPDLKRGGDCGDFSRREYCFDAGDPRVNEHSPIMSLHTVFLRLHNTFCDGLKEQNPNWDDERLYQEARKIVIAAFQHISYDEWLVWIIGRKLMDKHSLWSGKGTDRTTYDPKVDPTVQTEFSTAAYRLHSIIGEIVSAFLDDEKKWLRQEYNDAELIYRNGINDLLSGIIKTDSQSQDKSLVNDVTDFLYRKKNAPYGLDLAALNIQRGRDHGLAPYIDFVKFCSGKEIKTFDDLSQLMTRKNVNLLKRAYEDVADIDAWSGIQMERHSNGAIVGPTAGCIIARGFFTWKFGDRFYYENPGVFTDDQLIEIKKMILSAIICQTTSIEQIHKFAFLCPFDDINPLVPCSELPKIDLSKWKETSQS